MKRIKKGIPLFLIVLLLIVNIGCGAKPETTAETETPGTEAPIQWNAEVLSFVVGELYDLCQDGTRFRLAADSGIYSLDQKLALTGEVLPDWGILTAMKGDRLLYISYDADTDGYAVFDESGVLSPLDGVRTLDCVQLWSKGDTIWICDGSRLVRNGTELELPQEPGALWHATVLVETEDGLFVVLIRIAQDSLQTTEAWLIPVDGSTKTLSQKEGKELPEALWNARGFCSPDSGCVYSDGALWRVKGGIVTRYVELTQFGVNPAQLRRVLVTEDRILCLHTDCLLALAPEKANSNIQPSDSSPDDSQGESLTFTESPELSTSSSTEPKPPAEKKNLRVGTLWETRTLQTLVAYINRSDAACRLTIKTFEDLEQLNLAILNGEIDLLVLNDIPTLRNYAGKDLLQPIDTLLPELFSSDVLYPNMIECLQDTGHCWFLPPVMEPNVNLLPKRYEVEPESLDSLAALATLLEEKDPESYGLSTREMVFYGWMSQLLDCWIDAEAGTASFDSMEFVELLEFCGCYVLTPEETLANQQSGAASAGLTHLQWNSTLYVGNSYQLADYLFFRLPYGELSKISLYSDTYLAAVNGADEEAVRSLFEAVLTDDGWHTKAKRMWENSMMRQVFLNRQWTEQDIVEAKEKTLSYEYPGDDFKTDEFEAFLNTVRKDLNEADHFQYVNSELLNIITEEARVYFNGDCTAEEAARRIQNRVEIYLAERG